MAHVIVADRCTKDNLCQESCPVACIAPEVGDERYETVDSLFIDPETCTDCAACVAVCPSDAIFEESDVPAEFTDAVAVNRAYFN